MDSYSEAFKTWMDDRGLTPENIAAEIKKEAGTLKQWRSRGVPTRDSVRAHVTSFMADYDSKKIEELKTLDVLNLEIPADKFDRWNQAALDQGLIIREWAIQGLDRLAKKEFAPRIVAEDTPVYNQDNSAARAKKFNEAEPPPHDSRPAAEDQEA